MTTILEDDKFMEFLYKRLSGYPLNIVDKKGRALFLGDQVKVYNNNSYEYGIIKYEIFEDYFYIELYDIVNGYDNKRNIFIQEEDNTHSNILEKVLTHTIDNFYEGCIRKNTDVSFRRTCECLLYLYRQCKVYFTKDELERLNEINKKYTDFKITINFSIVPEKDRKELTKKLEALMNELETSVDYNKFVTVNKLNVKTYVY